MRITIPYSGDEAVRIPYEVATITLADALRREYGPGLYPVIVAHDDGCPTLSGGRCNCEYDLVVDVPEDSRGAR